MRSFKICGIWPHNFRKCSYASVGLGQARPNKHDKINSHWGYILPCGSTSYLGASYLQSVADKTKTRLATSWQRIYEVTYWLSILGKPSLILVYLPDQRWWIDGYGGCARISQTGRSVPLPLILLLKTWAWIQRNIQCGCQELMCSEACD